MRDHGVQMVDSPHLVTRATLLQLLTGLIVRGILYLDLIQISIECPRHNNCGCGSGLDIGAIEKEFM